MKKDSLTLKILSLFPILIFYLYACSHTQIPGPQSLTETGDYKQAFDKGMKAAEKEKWDLAIRYFSEAQTKAPLNPSILYNLGLAHAKADHELAAIAWLEAYLAAAPKAQNKKEVQEEISQLERSNEEKVKRIYKTALETARQIRDESEKDSALSYISSSQAVAGDIEGSLAIDKLRNASNASFLWSIYAQTLAEAGDLSGSKAALSHVSESGHRDDVWLAVSNTLIRQGFLNAAWAAAMKIISPTKRSEAIRAIGHSAVWKSDFMWVEPALSVMYKEDSPLVLLQIVRKQILSGERARALQTANRIEDPLVKTLGLAMIGFGLLRHGTILELNSIQQEIRSLIETQLHASQKHDRPNVIDLLEIAAIQLALNDSEGAGKTARTILGLKGLDEAEAAIAEALLLKGKIDEALDFLLNWKKGRFEEDDPIGSFYVFVLQAIKESYLTNGDLTSAEKTIAMYPDIVSRVAAILDLVDAYRKKQIYSEADRLLDAATFSIAEKLDPLKGIGALSLLERISTFRTEIGNQVDLKPQPYSPGLIVWLGIARFLSQDENVVNLNKALKEAVKDYSSKGEPVEAKDILKKISDVGRNLGLYQLDIQGLEKKLAREV